MDYLEFILLGILQGITEFLPISSSGHLLIGRKLFNMNEHGLVIEVFLHLGTLFSILVFWFKDIKLEFKKFVLGDMKFVLSIVLATLPAGIIGFLFSDNIEYIFFNINSIKYLSLNYFILSIILFFSKFFMDGKNTTISYRDALIIGVIQCFAILPGLSRSGLTIIVGLYLGLNFKESSKFSFMLAIPILIFATINSLTDYKLLYLYNINIQLLLGIAFSFISGYLILMLIQKILQYNKFWYFSFYCLFLSLVILYGS